MFCFLVWNLIRKNSTKLFNFKIGRTAVISDLGLAKPLAESAGTFCGTEGYMAPEIGKSPYGTAVDIYALGAMMLCDLLPACGQMKPVDKLKEVASCPIEFY
jgi:serine/threonine protein kinase